MRTTQDVVISLNATFISLINRGNYHRYKEAETRGLWGRRGERERKKHTQHKEIVHNCCNFMSCLPAYLPFRFIIHFLIPCLSLLVIPRSLWTDDARNQRVVSAHTEAARP